MPEKTFAPGQSWEIQLRGTAEDVATQVRGLVRVPPAFKLAIADDILAVWPPEKLIAVKVFTRVNEIEARDKSKKHSLSINGSVTEL